MKRILKNPYVILAILIGLTGIVIYAPFIFGNYIFAYNDWGYDTRHAYIPAMEFYANRLEQLRWNDYDFSYGLGSSIFANMQMCTDPFNMFVIIIGSIAGIECIGYLVIFIHVAKSIILGLLGYHYLKLFEISSKSSLISAYILAFSGYILITGQHYFFATYAVLFILSLVLTEHAIRNKKMLKYMALSIALQGIVSPYVLFPSLIILGLYCIIRYIQNDENRKFQETLICLFRVFIYMIIGIGISMISFLPQTYEMMKVSQRIGNSQNIFDVIRNCFSPIHFEYIKTGFGRLFSNNLEGLMNSWDGAGVYFSVTPYYFSIFFPFCIVHQIYKTFTKNFTKNKKIIRIIIIILFAYTFFFNGVPLFFNLFAYIQHRFVYVFLPFFALFMADCLDDIFIKKEIYSNLYINTILCSVILLLCGFKNTGLYSRISLWVTICLFIVLGLSIILPYTINSKGNIKYICKITFYFCIVISIVFDSLISLYAERSPVTKENYKTAFHMPYMTEFNKTIESLEADNFIRSDRTFLGYDGSPDALFSFVVPMRTVSVYNSVLSKYTIDFFDHIMDKPIVTQMTYSLNDYGKIFDPIAATVLGLKYIISDKNIESKHWKLISEYEDKFLYQNQLMETAGIIYFQCITETLFESMDNIDKKFILPQAVVLDKELKDDKYENFNISYDIEKLENFIFDENSNLFCDRNSKGIKIHGKTNAEEKLTILTTQNKKEKVTLYLGLRVMLENDGTVILNTLDNNNYGREYSYDCRSGEEKELIIPISVDDEMIEISFPQTNISLTDIQLFSTTEIYYSNSVHLENHKMGNSVYGSIQADKDGFLFVPIVYDNNWIAYINNKRSEIMKADYGFLAIEVPKGTSEIVFKYVNKSLYVGIIISIFSVLLLLILIMKEKSYEHNKLQCTSSSR